MKPFRIVAVCLSLLVAFTSGASAQDGKITGKVTDAQGGVLSGATVVSKNIDTGISHTKATNAAGSYVFPSLPPGEYKVAVSMSGFRTYELNGLRLETGRSLTVDAALSLSGVEETLTVTAETPLIQTRESKVGGVVNDAQIENVPINTRDVQQLALLVPGARLANTFDPTKTRVPAISFGTNGSGRGILYLLDGGDNTDEFVGGIVQQVSMDSVQEFEVVTSRIKPEFARASGGAVSIVTKSGTNEFHGSVFDFFRDRSLNARTEQEKLADLEKGSFRRHQFGGNLGGPIVRDNAFFFVTYETIVEDVFSVLGVPPEIETLYDPAFLEAHGGLGRIDQPYRRSYLSAKYTQQFNARNRLDVRFALEDNQREGDHVGGDQGVARTRNNSTIQANDLWSILARLQTIVGTQGLNELVFQVSDWENIILGVEQPDFETSVPNLAFPSLETGQNGIAPQRTFQRKYQFRDTFSYSLDNHDIKFGGGIMRCDPCGGELFSSAPFFTYANDGDPIDQPLFFSQFENLPPIEFPNTVYGGFIQDDWRIGESLTLNLGIRYDYELGALSNIPYGDTGLRLVDDPRSPYFDMGNCQGEFNGVSNAFCLEDDSDNWAPRIGFAYDIGARGETVVRGGWGRFYDRIISNATIFTFTDAIGVRGVSLFMPGFGPDDTPRFDDLVERGGFVINGDNIVPPGFQLPYSDQLSLGFSHQITPTLAFDADYIRSNGRDRGKRFDLNEMSIAFDQASRLFHPDIRGRLRVIDSTGFDSYDGLQLSFRKRYENNLQFTLNYTLANLRGNSESGFGGDEEAECIPCIGGERDIGPYRNDTRHNFIGSFIASLPADLQLSMLVQMESGRARTSESILDLNGNGRRNSDYTAGPNGEPAGRGNFRGEPVYNFDLRLAKFFRFGGQKDLQLTLEVFNLFNRVQRQRHFAGIFESPNFGEWDGSVALPQRQIQLGVRFTF